MPSVNNKNKLSIIESVVVSILHSALTKITVVTFFNRVSLVVLCPNVVNFFTTNVMIDEERIRSRSVFFEIISIICIPSVDSC